VEEIAGGCTGCQRRLDCYQVAVVGRFGWEGVCRKSGTVVVVLPLDQREKDDDHHCPEIQAAVDFRIAGWEAH
jgi:hypothetical protein